ncbi:MAG: Ig-like domain repeat protein [Terracidiphilus sp.]
MTLVRLVRCTVKSCVLIRLFPLLLVLAYSAAVSALAQGRVARTAQIQSSAALLRSTSGQSTAGPAEQPRSLSMVSADFDGDGVADLAIGYGLSKGGAIGLMRGNLDAIAPQSHESWLAAGEGRFADPFLAPDKMISVPEIPELLLVGDINGDGRQDLVFAARNGHQLYVLLGDGKGHFALQTPITVGGAITAMAAYRPASGASEAVLVGLTTSDGSSVALFRSSGAGLQQRAIYELPGSASAIQVANLDSDLTPDAAIVAGGQLLVLHGQNAISGGGHIETLPVSNVETVTAGEFLFDRHALTQLAALTSNGDVLILAHQGFDARPFTPQEIAQKRAQQRGKRSVAPLTDPTADTPWTVVETDSQAAPHSSPSDLPILLRSRISGSGGDDLLVLNSTQQQRVTISHSTGIAKAAAIAAFARVAATPLTSSDNLVAAVSVRVNADGRQGVAMLGSGPRPQFQVPSAGNTFFVNTTADNTGTTTDADDGTRCTNGSAEVCTLRDAVTFANADATSNGSTNSDTIMVPAGTYTLTWQAGTFDVNGNALTHLEILGPVTIIGSTSGGGVTINAANNDTVFTINPGPFGSFNPSGNSYVFDATLENLLIENGTNKNNINTSATGFSNNVGGCINWDAFGTGNLTLTNSSVENCTILWGTGGGIWAFNSAGGGTGTLTLTGGTISNNSTPEQGGGLYMGFAPTGLTITNTIFLANKAEISVNPADPGGAAGLGDGGGLFLSDRGTTTPRTTLSGVTIISNIANGQGGGINTTTGISLGTSTVSNNTATSQGGGVYLEIGPGEQGVNITSSNILNNSATTTGGGVFVGNDTPSTGDALSMTLSRIFGNTSTSGTTGLAVAGAGTATATENWWGCNAGPTNASCDKADSVATTAPFARLAISAIPTTITIGANIDLTTSLNKDSNGLAILGAFPAVNGDTITYDVTGVTASPALTTGTFTSTGIDTPILTPSSAGNGTVSAKFDNQTVSVNFMVNAPPVTHFAVSAPATATAGVAFNFTITALDAGNATVTGYTGTVHFTSTDGAAILPANSTLVNGVGTFSATLDTAGTQTISVADTVTTSATGTSGTITVSPGALSHFSITGPGTVGSFQNNAFSITALDFANNVVTSFNGTVTLTSSDPGFVPSSGNPAQLTNGVLGSYNAALKTAGTQTITATDTANSAITGTISVNVLPGSTTRFVVSAPASASMGGAFNFTVTALDLFGNATPGYAGTVHFTSSDGSAVLPADSTLINGVGTFSATLETVGSQTITATDTVTTSITGTSGNIAVTIPNFTVLNNIDSGAGSLRAALNAAATAGSGTVTFDPTFFATPQTITLASGTLTIPPNTTINGPTTGSGATLTNLVTVSGAGTVGVFSHTSGVAAISGLIITDGNNSGGNGGGVFNAPGATLTISNCTVSGNTASFGGGLYNYGTMTVSNCTISGNTASTWGGGILTQGSSALTVSNSTISGNSAADGGGIINLSGATNLTNTTISNNSATSNGGGIASQATLTLANTIISGNTSAGINPDVPAGYTDNGGNVVGSTNIDLAPLGNYGGSAQTMIPLPGSPAICFINPSTATGADQRGLPRTTTYNAITCQDSGSVQSNYSLAFSTEPPANVSALTNFVAGVTLNESGNPFLVTATPSPTITIPLALSGTGTLTGGSIAINDATGIATYSALQVSQTGANDTLTANLILNPATPLSISATSSPFDVGLAATTTTTANATATFSESSQTVTLSATVTSTSGTVNAGNVVFSVFQGATQIGVPVTGSVVNGAATAGFVLPAASPAGTYTIQVTYNGTATLATSSDNTHTLTVNAATTTTAAVNATATYSATAQNVALTATVTSSAGTVNAGTVTFSVFQGVTLIGASVTSGTVTNDTATASYTLPAGTAAGTYTIQATYGGTVSLSTSSDNTHTLTVGQAATATVATNATATYNTAAQNVTLSATVSSPSGAVNAGTVTFSVFQGATQIGATIVSGTVTNGAASVTFVLPAGTAAGSYTIHAAYSGNASLGSSSDNTHTLTVNQATPAITWPAPAAITYGTALSATQLNATSAIAGSFAYTPTAGTILTAGTHTLSVTLTPTDTVDYATATATVSLTVNQATPTITWANPAAIAYGTALSATQLDATSTVAGTFVYTPAAGTVLTAGSHTLSVTLTPTDTTDYTTATTTVTIIVNQAAPAITWPAPAAIVYGTALSAAQLDASSAVAGAFAYTPAAGTVLTAGSHTLSVTFTPTDTTDYTTASANVTITVSQATPPIVWPAPAAITYGTALSGTQLDATSTVAGAFVYNPAAGTVLTAGSHTLSVTFTPTDTADYTTATASVTLQVNNQPQTITLSAGTLADAAGVTFGVAPLTLSATATSGLPVVFSVVSGPATLNGNVLTITGAGAVIFAANQPGNSNYAAAPQVTEAIPVNKAVSTVAIVSSVNPILAQNGITFTATVTSGSGTPTGTVTFLDGTTPLGTGTLSGGVATFATSSLAAGSHSITAAYGGDTNFLAAVSSALTQQVEDFGFTISTQSVTVSPGGQAVFTFTVNPIDGTTFPAAITFTATGLPQGATYTFSPASVAAGQGSTTVTLTVDVAQTQAGINPANLHPNVQAARNGADGNAGSRGTPNSTVANRVAPFALALILLPFAGRIGRAGKRMSRLLSVLLLLVAGMAAVAGISGCGSTSGFFAHKQQSYTVTVTGTSGALTHSATVTLTVE